MVLFSCSKEEVTEPTFVEKEFFIENPETATARVLDFLSYTDLAETTLRNNYPDTEVNEGLWTLEAAGNYVDNVNLSYKSETTIHYNLSVTNINDNGVLKMSGADMTDRFNELQTSIAAEEQANGKTAKIVDFQIGSVSSQQTDLIVGVIYAAPPPPGEECEDWPASESIWSAHIPLINCLLAHTINYAWYQTIKITNAGQTIRNCYPEMNISESMYELEGDVEPFEFDEAYDAAQATVSCVTLDLFGPPTGNTSNSYGHDLLLVDIDIQGSGVGSFSIFECFEIVVGRGGSI